QGAAEIQPKESPPPDKPDAPAPSRSDALERDTEKIPAISASTSKAETASSPNTETTPTAGRRLGQCRPGRSVDNTRNSIAGPKSPAGQRGPGGLDIVDSPRADEIAVA